MRNQWEPKVVLLFHKKSSEEMSLILEEVASFVYDYFCQLQGFKSDQSYETEFHVTNPQRIEELKRTGSDV